MKSYKIAYVMPKNRLRLELRPKLLGELATLPQTPYRRPSPRLLWRLVPAFGN